MKYLITILTLALSIHSNAQYCTGTVSDLTVSTGWNPNTNSVIGDYDMDPMWRLIQAPADPPGWTSNIGGPAIAVPTQSAWDIAGANSKYINAYPTAQALTDNWSSSTTQYIYQREFCVCAPTVNAMVDVTFNLSLFADNWAELYLEDPNGNQTLLMSQNYVYQTANFQNTPIQINTTLQLTSGTYKLLLHHRNKLIVMGANLDGKIYSNGVLSNNECTPRGIIGGYSREDSNNSGSIENQDVKSAGWTMELRDANNVTVGTKTTDNNGYYFFMDLDPGTYTVYATPPTGWSCIIPQSYSYTTSVNMNVVNVKEFLGVPDETINPQPEFPAANAPIDNGSESCIVKAPNVFTPNGDAINDKLFFSTHCTVPAHVSIVDRWGNSVYESDDITEGWDGTSNGKLVNPGTYFYKVTIQHESQEPEVHSGFVQLIR